MSATVGAIEVVEAVEVIEEPVQATTAYEVIQPTAYTGATYTTGVPTFTTAPATSGYIRSAAAPVTYAAPATTISAAPVTYAAPATTISAATVAPTFSYAAPSTTAPIVYSSAAMPAPVTYAAAPVTTSTIVQPASSFLMTAGQTFTSGGPNGTVMTLAKGSRVKYTSKTSGQVFDATVIERAADGWHLKLDVDGGVKTVPDSEMWRVTLGEVVEVKEEFIVKEKVKVKSTKKVKKSKKGCCA